MTLIPIRSVSPSFKVTSTIQGGTTNTPGFVPIDLLLSGYGQQRIPVDFERTESLLDEEDSRETIDKQVPLVLQELNRIVDRNERLVGGRPIMNQFIRLGEQSSVRGNVADMAFRRGHFLRALRYYESAVGECSNDRIQDEQAIDLLGNIGHCHRFMNNDEKAVESYTEALRRNEQSANHLKRSNWHSTFVLLKTWNMPTFFAKGEIYRNQHLPSEALPLLLQALELRLGQKDPSTHPATMAHIHSCLGLTFGANEQYTEALVHTEKAWALMRAVYPDGCCLDLIHQYEQNVADIRLKLGLPFDRHVKVKLSKVDFDGNRKYTYKPYSDEKTELSEHRNLDENDIVCVTQALVKWSGNRGKYTYTSIKATQFDSPSKVSCTL
ncbi:unnamed protein product [Didymodactylos carnosus]|uniref:Tetratricopeptide repeat protein n=1 Tax=Didymodactylos carnosus TaxID=1234261 RepID=A0A814ZF12_9BILA|nr:unnamed protein product [Didymodactylos carnosus]CAF4009263.1 unnamed protein product [Didymodactylos carnosus]